MKVSRQEFLSNPGTFEIRFRDQHQQEQDYQEVVLGLGSEVLSDGLLSELVDRGWPKEYLLSAQKNGWRYSRKRDSLIKGR